MSKIVLGPVIGKVTDTTARVLIEVDSDCSVSCIAKSSGGGAAATQMLAFKNGEPLAFQLSGLQPSTEYHIDFQGVTNAAERTGRLRTYSSSPDRMNIAAVSCNFTICRETTDLWSDLRDRYIKPGHIDMILHIGDQIYGDQAFAQALLILNGKTKGTKAQEAQIMDLYKWLYRHTWNYGPTQEVLSSVPNLMIWDDHDIRDDWGSRSTDYDPQSGEFYVGTLARTVYRQYQRQLWDDQYQPSQPPTSGFEHHFHKWGSIGVLFLDQRGGRSFQRDATKPYLGTSQWAELTKALAPGGLFSAVRALVVVTSVPLAYLSSNLTVLGSNVINDLMDHWSYGPHRKEQIELIRALRRWKEDSTAGRRELLVVGGDVHVGGHTQIKYHDKVIFQQLITSPITNNPPKWFEFYGIRLLSESQENLGDSYSFEHHNYTNRRNYGIIVVGVPEPNATPKVEATLVEAV
jgi:hypothetical protein